MKKTFLAAALLSLPLARAAAQQAPKTPAQDKLLYGVAYDDEYMPYDRLDQDVAMMKAAGINVVRIAESTWSTQEPQEGVFDYSHVDRVLNATHKAGIWVIIGTPTYAVPTWLLRKYPAVLATTDRGANQYATRQNMDISNSDYRQNFDLGWRGHSFGLQPEVNHFAASQALDVAGVDIYHPSQSQLTGTEIAFGGDLTRGMKGGQNYLVLETETQGFPQWTPYPGQLRQQAFSHLASGANTVEYWHWASTHNSAETYWKGVLSHDLPPNYVYDEVKTIGRDFQRLSPQLVNLKKTNKVTVLFSNEALTAKGWFGNDLDYNQVLRQFYDPPCRHNVGCDLVDPSSPSLDQYKLLIVPMLYAAPTSLLERLAKYVQQGGHLLVTYRSGFADENVQVRHTAQPGGLSKACGVTYQEFTTPGKMSPHGNPYQVSAADNQVNTWMEFLTPTTAKVLARYEHPAWGRYAAITENQYGRGLATYVGCRPSDAVADKLVTNAVRQTGLWHPDQELEFPPITRGGRNQAGKTVRYYFNYAATPGTVAYPHGAGRERLSGAAVRPGQPLQLRAWSCQLIEEK